MTVQNKVIDKYLGQPRATNLTQEQQNLLYEIRNHPELMIIGSDKNLGTYVIKHKTHYRMVYQQHLSNNNIYQSITKQ